MISNEFGLNLETVLSYTWCLIFITMLNVILINVVEPEEKS